MVNLRVMMRDGTEQNFRLLHEDHWQFDANTKFVAIGIPNKAGTAAETGIYIPFDLIKQIESVVTD